MHVTTLQPGTATNTIIVQPTENYPLLVKPATTWLHREVALSGQPTEQQVYYTQDTQVSTPAPQAVYYPVSLPDETALSMVPAQNNTYPITVVPTQRKIPVFFPTQEAGFYFSRPALCPAFPAFSPMQTNLNPYSSPHQAVPETAIQCLPQDPTGITPAKGSEVLKIMELVTSNGGRIFTATVIGIANNHRGTGNIQLESFNLKVGLHFPSPITTSNLISLPVQGKLCFSSRQALAQYLFRQPLGCFYTIDLQRESVGRIPIFLKCDQVELSSSTQPRISHDTTEPLDAEEEIHKIIDHLKSLNEKRVNARIIFFDSKQVGGIACHKDPTSGYITYFMFRTPSVYFSIPVSSLREQFSHLEATIEHSMSDTELSDYIVSLGVGSFLDQGIRRKGSIQIFSHTITFVSDD